MRAKQTHGMGIALEDHFALGYEIARRVRHARRICGWASALVGQRTRRARGGGERFRAVARSLQGPCLLPCPTRPWLVTVQGTPAAGGRSSARVDKVDSILRDGVAGTGLDNGTFCVCFGACHRCRRSGSGWNRRSLGSLCSRRDDGERHELGKNGGRQSGNVFIINKMCEQLTEHGVPSFVYAR